MTVTTGGRALRSAGSSTNEKPGSSSGVNDLYHDLEILGEDLHRIATHRLIE